MTTLELRKKFLEFFKEKGHKVIPSSSLIPEHDPTVLFTTAGMHPLTPFLLGEKHPAGKRLVNYQKCIRTSDIESVGDAWHLTFFEMLGNWSLGDYWKREAIEWSFEFLIDKKWLGILPEKLNITVFAGDKYAPRDEESFEIWRNLGIPKERIYFLSKEENWWGPVGEIGPCGPCTEIFYDIGVKKCGPNCRPGCSCEKYTEIWNNVFMEFNKIRGEKYEQLLQKNVDTGMGLERTAAVLSGFNNVYEIELFKPIIQKIKEIASIDYNLKPKVYRIIADHLKTAVFILGEGIEPSNVEQGYVLRRLIRRAIRCGKQLGIKEIFSHKIAQVIIDTYSEIYFEIHKEKDFIFEQLIREEEKFKKTLEKGLKEFELRINNCELRKSKIVPGKIVFDLYQSYGFPLELTKELAQEKGLEVDERAFREEFQRHQEISRVGAERKFKGGLTDHSEKVVKYHTATHLLLSALRKILGEHVRQRGSNITPERLRFDFSHSKKLTQEEIKKIENLVNQKIKENLKVKWEEMPLSRAKQEGAVGVFEKKYGDRVKVYTIFNEKTKEIFSKEICGGPHVDLTSVLGEFKIIKEESVSAGVRRIKAILQ